MNFEQIKKILFREAKKAGLSEFDVYFRMSSESAAEALNRELSSFSSGTVGGVSFRCTVDGRLGSAATQCLQEAELCALVPRAVANATVIDTDEQPIFFEGSAHYQAPTAVLPDIPDAAELRRAVLALQEELYAASDRVTDGTSSAAGGAMTEVSIANSKGLLLSHRMGMTYTYAEAVVKEGEEAAYGTSFGKMPLSDACALSHKAVDEALSKLGAGNVKTGKYDVIFSARQVRTLLAAFSGVFSGKNALLGLSLLRGKEGSAVAAPCLSLVDDPFYAENTVQLPFDAEGVAVFEKKVIDKGVLQTLLYDLTTAKKAGCATTGNAQRGSYADPISIAPYCLRVEGGVYTPEELRARLGDGLYITELKGLHAGADAVTGDFSIESAGFLVKNGALAAPVHSFTVAGNFFELLRAVDGVADNVEMGMSSLSCIAAPDLLVRGLSVAGE
ncbi:MAG: TldD/PmbA family protein [Clostridia bacterium]|nr:TldD/PmbA family protein [Clostridia bacterium]